MIFQALQHRNNDLEKQNSALKRQLECETLLRIDLENKNKTLREELTFNAQVHDTVIEKTSLFQINPFSFSLFSDFNNSKNNKLMNFFILMV